MPADRFRVVMLDELVGPDRESVYAELLDFLGVEDEPVVHEFFEREMTPANAHVGRWRQGLHAPSRLLVQKRYERTVAALEREGNHAAPSLRAVLDREAAGAHA